MECERKAGIERRDEPCYLGCAEVGKTMKTIRHQEQEAKVWGAARHVFASPHAAVSILDTQAGGYCSRHLHSQRVNRFIVQTGSIDVVEYDLSGEDEVYRLTLGPGDVHDVEANVIHRFEVNEPGLVIEVYYPADERCKVSHDDIVRLDIGGKL